MFLEGKGMYVECENTIRGTTACWVMWGGGDRKRNSWRESSTHQTVVHTHAQRKRFTRREEKEHPLVFCGIGGA